MFDKLHFHKEHIEVIVNNMYKIFFKKLFIKFDFILNVAIATSEVEDVRTVLEYYSQFDDPIQVFKENQRKLQVIVINFVVLII